MKIAMSHEAKQKWEAARHNHNPGDLAVCFSMNFLIAFRIERCVETTVPSVHLMGLSGTNGVV